MVTMLATENTSSDKREATITFTGLNVQQQFVSITQSGISTDINDNAEDEIVIYPNPSKGIIYFKQNDSNSISRMFLVSVYDITGKTVVEKRINESNKELDLTLLEKGLYFVKFQLDNNVFVKKIILE